MRTLLTTLSFGIGLMAISSVFADRNAEHSEKFSFSRDAGQGHRLLLNNSNGKIEIRGVPDLKEVRITGTKIATGRTPEEAKNNVGKIEIDVQQNSNGLTITTRQPSDGDNEGSTNYKVDYYIEMPANWNAQAHNANGLVGAEGLTNGISTTVANGAVEIKDVTGTVEAEVSNGMIKSNAKIPDNATCRLKTSNGAINATLEVASKASCDLQTTNGPVKLTLPRTTSAGVSAITSVGKVSVDGLDFTNRISNRDNPAGDEFKGTLGSGSSTIVVNTTNGPILLKGL